MSLINRMLSDLEERRGGNLRNVDHAIDGLRATPGPTVRRKKRIAPATLATGLVIAGLAGLCAYLFLSRPPATAVVEAPAVAPVVAPAPAAMPPATAPVQAQTVVIADTPAPAVAAPAQAAAPVAVAAQPAAPAPAREKTERATPPAAQTEVASASAAAWPEPEPEPAPAPKPRRRMLSKADTEEHNEPLVDAAKPAAAASESTRAAGSFHIAEAAPASAADEAVALLEAGDTAGAESLLREGLAKAPGDTAMARVLGHILLASNDARGAVQVMRPAAPTVEADPDYHALLAAAEQRSGAHEQAIRRYRELLAQKPGNGAWLVGLGISLRASGDATGASDAFLQALADPELPAPLHDFAMQQATQVKERQP